MAIYDCFMFNDENEILELRLRYLKDFVDFFVIAESEFNFSGQLKPINSTSIIEKLQIPEEKIIRVRYKFTPKDLELLSLARGKYELEKIARNSLLQVIRNLEDEDYVIVSDVDEIPTREQLSGALQSSEVTSILTPLHYGKMNWLSPDGHDWNTVKAGHAKFFKNEDLNIFKYRRFKIIRHAPGGHYSDQFRTIEEVLVKAKNSSHSEFNQEKEFQRSVFEYAQLYRVNHFGRFFRRGMGLIKNIKPGSLNDIELLALEYDIFEFDYSKSNLPILKRFIASYRVTKSWSTGIPPAEISHLSVVEILTASLEWTKSYIMTKRRKFLDRFGLL